MTVEDLRQELERAGDLATYLDRHLAAKQWDRAERDLAQLEDQVLAIVTAVRDLRLRVREPRTEAIPAGGP